MGATKYNNGDTVATYALIGFNEKNKYILPNLLILRLVLLLLVLMANNCIWILEQPRQSLLGSHRRFSWMINHVAYVA